MDAPSLVYFLIAVFIGLPSAVKIRIRGGLRISLRNPTALALVASYAIVQAWWLLTGEGFHPYISVLLDYMVLTVIFLKGELMIVSPTNGLWAQAVGLWRARTWWDRVIICSFAPTFVTYALAADFYYKWWILWAIAVFQFLAAGAEALEVWRRGRAEREETHPTDMPMRRSGIVSYGW